MEITDIENKTKEDLLDIYFNLLSSRGRVVEYRWMKNLSREELIERISKIDEDYNVVVYEFDLEGNTNIYKGNFTDDKRVLKYCGKTLIIETLVGYVNGILEREAEGNEISVKEKNIMNEVLARKIK